jgi:hypothetical protein
MVIGIAAAAVVTALLAYVLLPESTADRGGSASQSAAVAMLDSTALPTERASIAGPLSPDAPATATATASNSASAVEPLASGTPSGEPPGPTPTPRVVRRPPTQTATALPTPARGPALSPDDLVAGGGFENGLANWYVEGGVQIVAGGAHRGEFALELAPEGGYVDQRIEARAGTTYRLSVWGKLTTGGDAGSVGIVYRDASGTRLDWEEPAELTFSTGEYARLRLTFTVPEGVATVQIYLWKAPGPAAVLADDVSVRAVVPADAAARPSDTPTAPAEER